MVCRQTVGRATEGSPQSGTAMTWPLGSSVRSCPQFGHGLTPALVLTPSWTAVVGKSVGRNSSHAGHCWASGAVMVGLLAVSGDAVMACWHPTPDIERTDRALAAHPAVHRRQDDSSAVAGRAGVAVPDAEPSPPEPKPVPPIAELL